MSTTLILGSAVGLLIGAIHAFGLFRSNAKRSYGGNAEGQLRPKARAAYYGLWALVLWTAFGSYVLYLWLFAVALYACRGVARRLSTLGSA